MTFAAMDAMRCRYQVQRTEIFVGGAAHRNICHKSMEISRYPTIELVTRPGNQTLAHVANKMLI